MQPRHVLAPRMGLGEMGEDGVAIEILGVDPAATRERQHLLAHERAGIDADRAGLDEARGAQRQQVGRAGPGADEVDGHAGRLSGSAEAAPAKAGEDGAN